MRLSACRLSEERSVTASHEASQVYQPTTTSSSQEEVKEEGGREEN